MARRAVTAVLSAGLALSAVAVLAPAASAGLEAGPVVEARAGGATWHSSPSASAAVTSSDPAGYHRNVSCWTYGDFVRVPGGRWTPIWYRFAYPQNGPEWVSAADVRVTSEEKPVRCLGRMPRL